MTPKEAVAAAYASNRDWMSTHVGIVEFILSECEMDNVGNDEYDNVILGNPGAARAEAEQADALDHNFQVQLSLAIPKAAWAAAYGSELTAEGVQEFLQNAVFIGSDQVSVAVNSIVDENE